MSGDSPGAVGKEVVGMENYKIWFFFSQFDKYLPSVCCIRELGRQRRGQRSEGLGQTAF